MSYLINNQQKVNDIIFANKNKMYGAYEIRSSYGNTIVKSLAIMMFGFGSIFAIAFYLNNKPNDEAKSTIPFIDTTTYTVTVNTPPEKLPEPVRTTPPAGGGSNGLGTVISSTAAVDSGTTIEVATTPFSGTTTTDGATGPSTPSVVSTGTTNVDVEQIVMIPDSAPEFEGGLRALYSFLGSKLKYPEVAHEVGKEGTVYVKFVVDQKGKVGSLKLLNNLGYGLDEEALRVVSMIPDFKKPGKVNGRAVKVYYQLPIKFKVR
ncbi:MAG: energy transducer TonB [Bacteroidetes bacterium]|nr:energy transducer TonB [Bacteroidota bacterium]